MDNELGTRAAKNSNHVFCLEFSECAVFTSNKYLILSVYLRFQLFLSKAAKKLCLPK